MSVLLLLFAAVALGFILIVLIAVFAPRNAPASSVEEDDDPSPIRALDATDLGKLVSALLEKMGLEIERIQGGKNEILEIRAMNTAPVTGGSLLIHCLAATNVSDCVDGPAVRKFIRSVRSAYVSKGLLFTSGTFTPDAVLEAEDAPIELFDRHRIESLVEEYADGDDDDAGSD